MSALALFVSGDKAHVVTDGAGCVGKRMMTRQVKTMAVPHLGIAVGLRGHFGLLKRVWHEIQQLSGPEAVIDVLPGRMKALYRGRARWWPSLFGFDIGIAGYDGRGPYTALLSSLDRPGHPAFELQWLGGTWMSPCISEADVERACGLIDHDPDAAGICILDGMRKAGGAVIGAFGQITSVGPNSISTRCLKVYPDQIMQPIDPTTGLTPVRPASVIGSNYRMA